MRKVLLAAAVVAAVVVPTSLAGTALRLEVEGLTDRADLVFEGRVLSTRAIPTANGRIETEVQVFVQRAFWGAAGTQTFRMPGGSLPDGRSLVIPGMPAVEPGDDAIFFLTREGPTGVRMPVGLAQGKMDVFTDLQGYRALARNQAELSFVNPVTGEIVEADPRAVLDYQDTVSRIQQAVTARRIREAGEER
jgi:hypothetical protein